MNGVLLAMRILVGVSPFVGYFLTYYVCLELQKQDNPSKRKTTNIVTRTPEGEYIATPAPAYAEDVHHELDAMPVPTFLEPVPVATDGTGVRTVER
jgi:hypothetical protein